MRLGKGDVVSASLTLIIGAISYWIGGQKSALIALGAGAILMLVANFMRDSHNESLVPIPKPEQVSATISDSGNSTLNNVGNPKIEQHFYGIQAPVKPPEPKTTALPQQPQKPNLKLVNQRVTDLRVKTDGRHAQQLLYLEECTPDFGSKAAVATFRNQAIEGVRVPKIDNVRAHIIFTSRGGEELGTGISASPWVGEYHNTVEMPLGDPKTVLIGFYEKGKLQALTNRRSIFNSNWRADAQDEGIDFFDAEASPVIAEIQLLSYGGDVLLSHKFEIDTGAVPSIKRL